MVLLGICLHTTFLIDLLNLNILLDEEINNEIRPTILTLVENTLGTPLVLPEGLAISGEDHGQVTSNTYGSGKVPCWEYIAWTLNVQIVCKTPMNV